MKTAVIDLGTNTFHLIIAEISAKGIEVLYKTNVPVKLGQGRINENLIIPEAFERGINTLKDFKSVIDEYRADVTRAIATSAVRSAKNGKDFVEAAKTQGISIEVITGDTEAEYIFEGVKAAGVISGISLVMDIGGGSTEFILCDNEKLIWKKSYNIGAARLTQAYFKTDPISKENRNSIIEHLDRELAGLTEICKKHKPGILIGSAGAFETFAELLNKDFDPGHSVAADLDIKGYEQLAQWLVSSTHEERKNRKEIIPLRVDMIVVAAILTSYVISMIEPSAFRLSGYDLKMGVLHSIRKP